MGRFYTITGGFTSVTADVDVVEVTAGSSNPFIVHQMIISQSQDYGDSEAEGAEITLKRAYGSFTSGSGGGTGTVAKLNEADAADSLAAHEDFNDTIAVVGSGTLTTFWEEAMNIQAGWVYMPTPELRPFFNVSETFIAHIAATGGGNPADAWLLGYTLVVEEF